jgi:hypothetical protein
LAHTAVGAEFVVKEQKIGGDVQLSLSERCSTESVSIELQNRRASELVTLNRFDVLIHMLLQLHKCFL